LLAAALLAVQARPAPAQQKKADNPEPVTITTVDQVELKGHFYPSSKGAGAPVVVLLHALNEDSKKGGWITLARTLQKAGYAVLRFDFRGCGDSTTVKPGMPHFNPKMAKRGFWDEKENVAYFKGAANKRPNNINLTQFTAGYHPILANDLVAVKAWLDSAPCNSNNLTLIGAKEGATLGALWLNAEWNRYRLVPDPRRMMEVPDLENPEGQAVTAAVWLSISPTLGGRSVSLASLLYKPAAESKVPMLFFYSKGDVKGRTTALALEKVFKVGKGSKKNVSPLTGKAGEEITDKLIGSALLAGQVPEAISGWLKTTEKEKSVRKVDPGGEATSVWLAPVGARVMPRQASFRGRWMFFNFTPFLPQR